jgi:hypothetical protein
VQSEIGQPWSLVENGHAPFEICLYQYFKSPGQSSLTYKYEAFARVDIKVFVKLMVFLEDTPEFYQ